MRSNSKSRVRARSKTAPSRASVTTRKKKAIGKVRREIEEFKLRFENAEAALSAIHAGEVDALVISGSRDGNMFTVKSADQPYRVLVENMNEGALTVIGDGTILYCNRHFAKLAGMPPEKVIGRSLFDLVSPSDRGTLEAILREGIVAGGKWELVLAGSGGEIPVQVSATPLDVDGMRAVCTTVTDLRERLRSIDNARLYAEARAAAKMQEEFMSIASHELRTPLGALTLHVERLIEVAGREPAGALRTRLQKVVRQIERLTSIVDRLLDDSRISAGQLLLDLRECDLAAIARESVDRFTDQAARAGSALSVRIEGAVAGYWDSFRLEQVVSNLLSNAIKYGDGNRIEMTVEADPLRALLVVRDFGVGIGAEDVERIFERFHRSAATRQYGGLGLGLYITRQIVQAHRGTICVQSRAHQGSTFIVELPRDPRTIKSEAAGGLRTAP